MPLLTQDSQSIEFFATPCSYFQSCHTPQPSSDNQQVASLMPASKKFLM